MLSEKVPPIPNVMCTALEASVKLREENYDHDLTHDLCGGNQSIDFILEIETCATENCSEKREKRIEPTFFFHRCNRTRHSNCYLKLI